MTPIAIDRDDDGSTIIENIAKIVDLYKSDTFEENVCLDPFNNTRHPYVLIKPETRNKDLDILKHFEYRSPLVFSKSFKTKSKQIKVSPEKLAKRRKQALQKRARKITKRCK